MKITIITPCCRPDRLPKVFESINFDYVDKWIIVYDTSKDRTYTRIYTEHPKIIEAEFHDNGISGNDQRNFGLKYVTKGFVYFLDDDNIVHPEFWEVLPTLDENNMYSWDQENENGHVNKCYPPTVNAIDTAMFIIPYSLINDTRWMKQHIFSDGIFAASIYQKNKSNYIYIPKTLCYYNKLRQAEAKAN